MQRAAAVSSPTFSQPIRALTTMVVVLALVGTGIWAIHRQIEDILFTNPALNGLILLVFGVGVISCFVQVWSLAKSVSWIETFIRAPSGTPAEDAPRLLAPLANLFKSRTRNMSLSTSSGRSILDSVAQRIDESRDITRYLVNLLVFLGLLGTFWGLATTVPAVVETIRSLAPADGESGLDVFDKLMSGLESQLGGMGTAFSSSLLGLGGSLVLGLLDLFAGHGQNRFYRELEEWLSSMTRIGLGEGEAVSDQAAMVQVLDQVALQMESMQALYLQSEESRSAMEDRLGDLGAAVDRLASRLAAEANANSTAIAALTRVAEGQDRLFGALEARADQDPDAQSRMHLRSIDNKMMKLLEEMASGRQESIADLRAEIAGLSAALRQSARAPQGRV